MIMPVGVRLLSVWIIRWNLRYKRSSSVSIRSRGASMFSSTASLARSNDASMGIVLENTVEKRGSEFRQCILSHIITSKHAASLMIRAGRGLIVEVSENDTLFAGGNPLTQTVKLAIKGLALNMAPELRPHCITAVSITPGFLAVRIYVGAFGRDKKNWRDAGKKDPNFLESESPLFVGRAIAALASDPNSIEWTGQQLSSWELARVYSFTDYDGRRPDWGALAIDWSVLPSALRRTVPHRFTRTTRLAEHAARRTEQFITKLPPVS